MSAEVIAYSAAWYDTSLSLFVECKECGQEWGWCWDRDGNVDKLKLMAEEHNAEFHPRKVEEEK
jgi:hypothetical protein